MKIQKLETYLILYIIIYSNPFKHVSENKLRQGKINYKCFIPSTDLNI